MRTQQTETLTLESIASIEHKVIEIEKLQAYFQSNHIHQEVRKIILAFGVLFELGEENKSDEFAQCKINLELSVQNLTLDHLDQLFELMKDSTLKQLYSPLRQVMDKYDTSAWILEWIQSDVQQKRLTEDDWMKIMRSGAADRNVLSASGQSWFAAKKQTVEKEENQTSPPRPGSSSGDHDS